MVMRNFGSFSGGVGPEFLVTVQYILILVAVAGEDVGDQRLRILDQKAVFIRKPLSLWEKGARILWPFSRPNRS